MNDPEVPAPSPSGHLLIYVDGGTRLQVRLDGQSVWLTQVLMAELFQTTKQNISLHLQNIFDEGELEPAATVKQYLTVPVVSVGANLIDCRRGGKDQIRVIRLGEPDPWIADRVSLAKRIWRILRESVERRGGARIHWAAARVSCKTVVSGRIARMVAALRDCMGRAVYVGLNVEWNESAQGPDERPFQGRGHFSHLIPRPAAWADGTSLSGSTMFELLRVVVLRSVGSDRRTLRPERSVQSALGEALA